MKDNREGHKSEWQKMLDGEMYDAGHGSFQEALSKTRSLIWEFNSLHPSEEEGQKRIVRSMLGSIGGTFRINQPFRCDYGCNIFIGDNFFANFNLTILDEARVTIGDNVCIGPDVGIYTACHPLDADLRDTWVEWAEPVTIGDSVWIGGGSRILPGVTIGDRSVVGAGSVVTRDVPPGVVVAGNPARIVRHLD